MPCLAPPRSIRAPRTGSSGGDAGALEVLVRRAVVALGQRGSLTGLALARRRAAPGDAAVQGAGLDLLLDEGRCSGDPFLHGPGDFSLRGDREIPPNVLEESPVRLGEIERILGQPLHGLLAMLEHGAPVFELDGRSYVRVDQVPNRPIVSSGILIHNGLVAGRLP